MTSDVPSSSPGKHRGRRAALASILAGVVLAAGGVVTTTVAAPAAALVANTFIEATAPLRIETGATNRVALGSTVQPLSTTGACALSTDGSLIRFEGRVGATVTPVGFLNGSLGVAEKSSGTSCYEVNANRRALESLTLDFTGTQGGLPLSATRAQLDLELKGDAEVRATTIPSDGTAGEAFTLVSGASGCTSTNSDSGPDAREGDNCLWSFAPTKPFKGLRLDAVSGAFTLEGGSDWPASQGVDTRFTVGYVAQPSLACGSSTALDPSTDGTKPRVTLTRMTDVGGGCTSVPFTLAHGDENQSFRFLKPAGAVNAQFIIDVVWTKPIADGFDRTQVDWENPNTTRGLYNVPWCDADLYAGDALVGATSAAALAAIPDEDSGTGGLPGTQYLCIDSSNWKVASAGTKLRISEKLYLVGDIFIRRP